MSAQLHLVTPDQCLVEHVTKSLSALTTETLRRTLLIIPTQRLGTALLVRLLETRAALIPPEILTMESLIRSRPMQESADALYATAHDATIDLLLRARLEEHPYKHLKLGHERELRLLYGELFDHELRYEGLENLKTTIADDIYKNDAHLGSLYDRALEIEAVFDYLDHALEELKLRARTHSLSEDAKLLSRDWVQSSAHYEKIVLLGFTSMAKSWQILLPELLADDRVSFWLSEAPKLYHAQSPLKSLIETMEALHPQIVREKPLTTEIKAFSCFLAPSIRDEVLWAQKIVNEAIGKGFSSAKIGILVTDERLYGTAIRSAFEQAPLETNIALPESWGGTLAGRHLSAILQFWRERQSLPSLLAFMDHPLTKVQWPEPDTLKRLRAGLMRAGVPSGLDATRLELKEEFQKEFERLALFLRPLRLDQVLSLTQWLERLDETVATFGYWESFVGRDILQSSQELYEDFTASLKASGSRQPLMSGQSFWDMVESHLLKGSVRGTGEPLSGLQIMSLSEARYFPFDLAIILGCHEGCFPKALPQDELLDNYLKKKVGLPGWEMLEAMEDQTFHLLKARLPNLILLRSSRLGEEQLVRSRFTEALLAKSQLEETVLPTAEDFSSIDVSPLADEGQIESWLDYSTGRISASRLDKLLHCPYSFLLDSLGIQSEASRTDDADTRREGEWLHSVLQSFITGKGPKGKIAEPFHRTDISEEQAIERINAITDAMVPMDLRESALLHHLKAYSWPRYIQHLYRSVDADKSLREFNFGQTYSEVTVKVRGTTRELHGRIDALDFSSQWTFVTDFKRRTIPSQDKSKKGMNAQLSLYALALQQRSPVKPVTPLVLGYWNIYEGKWTAHGLDEVNRTLLLAGELCTKNTPTIPVMIESLLQSWEWRENEVLSTGRFYADPGDQCKHCDYAGLCRKDDPRVKDRIAQQNALEKRLAGHHA
ncbi:MAG: PD-(D/E)XK nuclease family protein [Proteobacteria bacterium]|nr:MAG: PD-(D/E)XK nuclease family protein [Pseudomonadota bacterium]